MLEYYGYFQLKQLVLPSKASFSPRFHASSSSFSHFHVNYHLFVVISVIFSSFLITFRLENISLFTLQSTTNLNINLPHFNWIIYFIFLFIFSFAIMDNRDRKTSNSIFPLLGWGWQTKCQSYLASLTKKISRRFQPCYIFSKWLLTF